MALQRYRIPGLWYRREEHPVCYEGAVIVLIHYQLNPYACNPACCIYQARSAIEFSNPWCWRAQISAETGNSSQAGWVSTSHNKSSKISDNGIS